MKLNTHKILALVLALCLSIGMTTFAAAEELQVSDFDSMRTMMDLVASAAISASDFPTIIGSSDSTMDINFITFFFSNGLTIDSSLGITEDMLTDTTLQAEYLASVFSAQAPTLDVITPPANTEDYIGFLPLFVEETEDGSYYLIGEIYRGTMSIEEMGDYDYESLEWEDRAIFTLISDDTAVNGYRIDAFSTGSQLVMEQEMLDYENAILMEYSNATLGFSLLYPSLFTDEYFTETENGASATLADGSASFSVKREENTDGVALGDYATDIAEVISGARLDINLDFEYATVSYETEDGQSVFVIYILTDDYIYTAEFIYPTSESITYNMYTMYLENSFVVDAVSVG